MFNGNSLQIQLFLIHALDILSAVSETSSFNIEAQDDQAMRGAKASASMVLT